MMIKIKQKILGAGIGLVGLIVGGCETGYYEVPTSRPVYVTTQEITLAPHNYPQFFTCNEWIDKNQNDLIENGEVIGLNKVDYKIGETVTFIGTNRSSVSVNAKIEIIADDIKEASVLTQNIINPGESMGVRITLAEFASDVAQKKFRADLTFDNKVVGQKYFYVRR